MKLYIEEMPAATSKRMRELEMDIESAAAFSVHIVSQNPYFVHKSMLQNAARSHFL